MTFDTAAPKQLHVTENTEKTLKMPVLLSLLPSLVCAVPGRRGLPKSGVGGCCHTLCACQGADTLAVDCDMSLT